MTRGKRLKGSPVLWRPGEAAPGGAHAAVVPGAEAPLLPLALPERLRGIARERVAERQLVEQLAMPAGSFEIRPYLGRGEKQWSRVLVADAGQAEAWRKALPAGCIALLPDYLTLPVAPDVWTISAEGGQVAARTGPGDGFTAEPDLARAMLAEAPAPRAILRLGAPDAGLDGWLATLKVPVCADEAALKKAGHTVLRWSDATGGIDLKDPPSAVYDRLRNRLTAWRTPVVFAVLALAAWLGSVILQTQRFQADAARDRGRMQELVREHFVQSGPILDVRAQVSAAMARSAEPLAPEATGLPPLAQFQTAAPVLLAGAARLLSASFRGDTGLVATVENSDFAALDRMIAALQEAGFLVEQLESRAQQSGGVVARLRLELVQ